MVDSKIEKAKVPDVDEIWAALEDVKDPEIPVLSVVELGVIRSVELEEDRILVRMTPTFSACPAFAAMKKAVRERVQEVTGNLPVDIQTQLSPPWSTDWLDAAARQKLKDFGLSPAPLHGGDLVRVLGEPVACPYCGSARTILKNAFGSTLCRAILYCEDCRQPFEQFKPL